MVSIKKTYSSAFEYFDPIIFYQDNINAKGPELLYLSEKAYYSINKLIADINTFFEKEGIELQTREVFSYVAGNRYKVLQEKVYFDQTIVISLLTDMKNIRDDIDNILESDAETLDDEVELQKLISKAVSDKMRCIIYIACHKSKGEVVDKFFNHTSSRVKKKPKKENEIGIITQDEMGLELR